MHRSLVIVVEIKNVTVKRDSNESYICFLELEKVFGTIQDQANHIIINFSQLTYINSIGIGLLVNIIDNLQEKGILVSVCNMPDRILALFQMLNLTELFSGVYDNIENCLSNVKDVYTKKTVSAKIKYDPYYA